MAVNTVLHLHLKTFTNLALSHLWYSSMGPTYPTSLKPVTSLQIQTGRILTFSEPVSHSEPFLKFLTLLKFSDIISSNIDVVRICRHAKD